MKRFLLLAVLGIVSCTALDDPAPGVGTPVSVTFEVGSYGSFPTKGMADAIAATLPATLDLQLTNTATGATYTAQTGAAVEIPAGTYEVTGGYTPDATNSVYGTSIYLSKAPKVSVAQDVTIAAGTGTYTLTAIYESCALVTLSSEVERWTGATNKKEGFDVDALEHGVYRWTFLTGELTEGRYFHTYLKPSDGSAQVSYTIIGDPALQTNFSDALVVVPGKWYLLRAGDDDVTAGTFAVEWPAWTEGTI